VNITAQEEYGVRCILQLVEQGAEETLTASEISEREGISVAYANKLLHILRQSGLIKSVRGVNGGFQLSRPANEITLADVLRALDSFMFETNICESFPGKLKRCIHYSKSCSIRAVWNVVLGEARALVSRTTLNELVGSPERSVADVMRSKVADRARGYSVRQKLNQGGVS
jgi:Rrf2 family protein